jgi:histidinol-phosphate aminotransferase
VRDVITDAAAGINSYPDNGADALTAAIARRHRVTASRVALGGGAAGVMQQLLTALAGPGAEVLYAWRSFEAYPLLSALAGATCVRVPLRDEAHDLAAMADAISERTRLIFVCTPNNPTGTATPAADFMRFLDRVPEHCLVALDEAYIEYITAADALDGLAACRDRPNVAVIRTFSKAYGLAGLRVGYLIGSEPVAAAVRKTMLPFTVNTLAQTAAIASLAAEAELLERVQEVIKERDRVRDTLLCHGWTVPPSHANFLWLRLGQQTKAFARQCQNSGLKVRAFADEGVRVAIGTPDANDAFLTVATGWRPAP